MKTRTIRFPKTTSLGHLHTRPGVYPYSFHGRYKKGGGLLEGIDNPGWDLHGEALGELSVTADCVLLEVQSESARDISPLSSLRPDDLDALWLGNTWVDDTQLRHLRHLTGLRWLNIENNGNITDAGIAEIAAMTSLLHLGIHWTRITDQGIQHLHGITGLQFLDVWGCPVSREALADLKLHLPNCRFRT